MPSLWHWCWFSITSTVIYKDITMGTDQYSFCQLSFFNGQPQWWTICTVNLLIYLLTIGHFTLQASEWKRFHKLPGKGSDFENVAETVLTIEQTCKKWILFKCMFPQQELKRCWYCGSRLLCSISVYVCPYLATVA